MVINVMKLSIIVKNAAYSSMSLQLPVSFYF